MSRILLLCAGILALCLALPQQSSLGDSPRKGRAVEKRTPDVIFVPTPL